MTIAAVRSALATALRTCEGAGHGLRASEYITEEIKPPQAMFDFEIEPDLTFQRGADVYMFTVTVFAGRASERATQVFLDELRDPNNTDGVKYVIEHNATLAAAVDYARVTGIGRVEVKTVGTAEYLCVDFEIEVVV